MQPYLNPNRRNMEDNLNIFFNGRSHQIFFNGRPHQSFSILIQLKEIWKTIYTCLKMEEDLNYLEHDLINKKYDNTTSNN